MRVIARVAEQSSPSKPAQWVRKNIAGPLPLQRGRRPRTTGGPGRARGGAHRGVVDEVDRHHDGDQDGDQHREDDVRPPRLPRPVARTHRFTSGARRGGSSRTAGTYLRPGFADTRRGWGGMSPTVADVGHRTATRSLARVEGCPTGARTDPDSRRPPTGGAGGDVPGIAVYSDVAITTNVRRHQLSRSTSGDPIAGTPRDGRTHVITRPTTINDDHGDQFPGALPARPARGPVPAGERHVRMRAAYVPKVNSAVQATSDGPSPRRPPYPRFRLTRFA